MDLYNKVIWCTFRNLGFICDTLQVLPDFLGQTQENLNNFSKNSQNSRIFVSLTQLNNEKYSNRLQMGFYIPFF